jgi:hypothetical protein
MSPTSSVAPAATRTTESKAVAQLVVLGAVQIVVKRSAHHRLHAAPLRARTCAQRFGL